MQCYVHLTEHCANERELPLNASDNSALLIDRWDGDRHGGDRANESRAPLTLSACGVG